MKTAISLPDAVFRRWAEAPGSVLMATRRTGLSKDSVANVSQIVTFCPPEVTSLLEERLRRKNVLVTVQPEIVVR